MNQYKIIVFLICALLAFSSCSDPKPKAAQESEEHHEEETNIVSLSPEQIKTVQIEIGEMQAKNLATAVKVAGKLEVPAQNKALVTSLYSGLLQSLAIHPGSTVRKGQVLAKVTNTEISGVQQQFISANAQVNFAQIEVERQQTLVSGNAAPLKNLQRAQAELTSLKAQRAALQKQLSALGISASSVSTGNISSTLSVIAPISGTISEITAQIGSNVDPATPIAQIVNNSELHLDLFVYEKDLRNVQVGQTIHFTLTNNPGLEYDAKIFSVGTAFADASKSVPVHAEVMGNKVGLIEGMSVTAIISIGSKTATAVPDEAIVSNGGKDYIFIQTDKKAEAHHEEEQSNHEANEKAHEDVAVNFERVQVIKGVSDLGYTEIQPVTDIPIGAKLVTKGAFFVMAKMTNTGEHEH